MAVKLKLFNEVNRGYGPKNMPAAFESQIEYLNSYVKRDYSRGAFQYVIDSGLDRLKVYGFGSTEDLQTMAEHHLATFYYLGKCYLGLSQVDNAIACFHIAYSQTVFANSMLPGFLEYAELAGAELQRIADRVGEEYVNNFDIVPFLQQNLTKKTGCSPCFVATAVYGTPDVFQLRTLREFRSRILYTNSVGQVLLKWYDVLGPWLARLIAHSYLACGAARVLVVSPAYMIAKLTLTVSSGNPTETERR